MPALKQSVLKSMDDSVPESKEDINGEKQIFNPNSVRTPFIAVPEKIVFCIDITEDSSYKPYLLKDGSDGNPFFILKKCLSGFIRNKKSLNIEHEFGVLSFGPAGVKWIQDFSRDPDEVIKSINDLSIIHQSEPIDNNLTPIFEELKKRIGNLPEVKIDTIQIPKYVLRLILIYTSSQNIPKINVSNEQYNYFISSSYFKLDILYLHDAPSEENKCQEIFDSLLTLSTPESYSFETSRKIVKLHNYMAKLLAHPFQRFEQPLYD